LSQKALQAAVLKMFGKKFAEKPELMEVNQRAFQVGYEAALKQKENLISKPRSPLHPFWSEELLHEVLGFSCYSLNR
jgi:hypothetical protein